MMKLILSTKYFEMEKNLRTIFTVILICILCMIKSEECSKDNNGYQLSEPTQNLQVKYSEEINYENIHYIYNLEKNHIFQYENVSDEFFKNFENEEYDCFKVYSDNFKQQVDISVKFDRENKSVKIEPRIVFSYFNFDGCFKIDGTWGEKSKFWLVQYIDTKTGKVFDKPIVTEFTIAHELNPPILTQRISKNGFYKLNWTEVEGADYYEVYKYLTQWPKEYCNLQIITENTSCEYRELADIKWFEAKIKQLADANDKNTQYLYSYFVVAKTNDGKCSGISNVCNVKDLANHRFHLE